MREIKKKDYLILMVKYKIKQEVAHRQHAAHGCVLFQLNGTWLCFLRNSSMVQENLNSLLMAETCS